MNGEVPRQSCCCLPDTQQEWDFRSCKPAGCCWLVKKAKELIFGKKRQWKRRDVVMSSYGKIRQVYILHMLYIYILSYNGAVMLWQLMSLFVCRQKTAATLGAWWMKLLELCWCRCESFGSLL